MRFNWQLHRPLDHHLSTACILTYNPGLPAACRSFVSAATKSAACNGRTTESACMSDTANVCSWNATNLPACDSNALVAEALKCLLFPTGPVCEWLVAGSQYCSAVTSQSSCNAKPGCAYKGTSCDMAPGKTMVVAANVAKGMGSSYADRILAVETSCNGYGSGTACTSAKVNSASAVVRAGSVVMALLAAMLVLLLLL
jgi:hypothetical protein